MPEILASIIKISCSLMTQSLSSSMAYQQYDNTVHIHEYQIGTVHVLESRSVPLVYCHVINIGRLDFLYMGTRITV